MLKYIYHLMQHTILKFNVRKCFKCKNYISKVKGEINNETTFIVLKIYIIHLEKKPMDVQTRYLKKTKVMIPLMSFKLIKLYHYYEKQNYGCVNLLFKKNDFRKILLNV